MGHAYWIALRSALVPLCLGVSIYLLWLATRWDWLMAAGYFTLLAGLLVFPVGCVALVAHVYRLRETGHPWRKGTWWAAGLLLINFPVATGILWHVSYLLFGYFVTVTNLSGQPVDLVIKSPLGTYRITSIAPGETIMKKYGNGEFGEGSVAYELKLGTHAQSGTLFEYVSNGMGSEATLTAHKDGSVTADERLLQ